MSNNIADVAIIGAGVVGCSIAWHLANAGCRNVVVIDRAPSFGGGSTPRATGGFRAQFSSEINVRLSLLAREKLRRFKDEVGADPGYAPHGYLFLARSEQALAQLRDAQCVQQACGLAEARMVSAEEARALSPAIDDDAIVGGTFCPTDGFIRAMQILRGYSDAASRLGVRFEFVNEVAALRDIRAGTIVNAAGAWASTLGIDIPVAPLRRQVASTIPTDVLPPTTPMTVWVDDGFHFRVRDGRVLLLWPDAPPIGFDITFNDAWLEPLQRFTRERTPMLSDVPIDRAECWAGLYEMTPDKHPIVGRVGNVVFANGFCGHGVMHAPAIGQLVAELVMGATPSIDITPLRPSRFAEGQPIVASSLL